MQTSWWIPFSAGFEDGLNICALVTCAVAIFTAVWAKANGLSKKDFLFSFFLPLFVVNYIAHIGVLGLLVSGEMFENAATAFYFALAVACGATGIVLIYDWVLLVRRKSTEALLSRRLLGRIQSVSLSRWQMIVALIVIAIVMGITASLWPMNALMSVVANNVFLAGQNMGALGSVFVYALIQMWLALVFAMVCSNASVPIRLRLVMSAAVFLSAAGAVVYIF